MSDHPVLMLAISEAGIPSYDMFGRAGPGHYSLLSPTHMSFQRKLLILNRLGRLITRQRYIKNSALQGKKYRRNKARFFRQSLPYCRHEKMDDD
jgi:hypothetical protein